MRGLTKSFPGQLALEGVDLDIRVGEVHALIGANGSGKSTLIKCLAGYHAPDPGAEVTVAGEVLPPGDPEKSRRLGLRFIHQELALIGSLSIADNLALGPGYGQRRGWLSSSTSVALAREALSHAGIRLHPSTPVSQLSAVDRTRVALARALYGPWTSPARVVVMDEPTASFPHTEVEHLFETIRGIAGRGVGVLYVSHNMAEVAAVSHRVTVLRDGHVQQTVGTGEVTTDDLIGAMVGSKLAALHARPAPSAARPRVRFHGVTGNTVRQLDLDVRPGEIVGLAGIEGSGRSEATYLLGGAVPWSAGSVEIEGVVRTQLRSHHTRAQGIVFVGSDRTRESAIPAMTARENVTLGGLRQCGRAWWVGRRAERRDATRWMTRLRVTPVMPERLLGQYSGGNQQKVVLARALRAGPSLLVIDQPVQGVDVGAKAAIFEELLKAAADGLALVVASSDPEDLAAICSRVLVLDRGRVVDELTGDDISVEHIERSTLGQRIGTPTTNDRERSHHG